VFGLVFILRFSADTPSAELKRYFEAIEESSFQYVQFNTLFSRADNVPPGLPNFSVLFEYLKSYSIGMGKVKSFSNSKINGNTATIDVVFENGTDTISLGKTSRENRDVWMVIIFQDIDPPFRFSNSYTVKQLVSQHSIYGIWNNLERKTTYIISNNDIIFTNDVNNTRMVASINGIHYVMNFNHSTRDSYPYGFRIIGIYTETNEQNSSVGDTYDRTFYFSKNNLSMIRSDITANIVWEKNSSVNGTSFNNR
jgi:hypothetical protein